jgi:hypothetical protein
MLKFIFLTAASVTLNCGFLYGKPWCALLAGGMFALALWLHN